MKVLRSEPKDAHSQLELNPWNTFEVEDCEFGPVIINKTENPSKDALGKTDKRLD